jgi:hypothetical protein
VNHKFNNSQANPHNNGHMLSVRDFYSNNENKQA